MSADTPLQGGGWGPPVEDVPLPVFEGWGPPAGFDANGEAIVDAELIEGEVISETPPPFMADVSQLPARLADDGSLAIAWFRDPDAVQTLARDAQGALLARISELAAGARSVRAKGRPTAAILAPELNLLGDAHDTLAAVQGVFAAGAKHAKMLAGEVAHELADDPRKGTTTVKVGDAHGTDLKVTRTQPTEVRVDEDDLVDVFVSLLVGRYAERATLPHPELVWEDVLRAYTQGARAAIDLYREQATAHKFKTSALDDLTRVLEGEGQDAVAIRLGHAYGRIPHGNPQVKIERAARKAAISGEPAPD